MVHVREFLSNMHICLRSQCLMLTFQYLLTSSCSIHSLVVPYWKDGLSKICNSLRIWYLVNQFATIRTEAAVLVLSFLKTYHYIFFECFVASASSRLYQTWFLRTITSRLMTFTNDRLVAQARPFLFRPFPFCSSTDQIWDMSTGSNWHYRTLSI